ncbi:MBL fold metallo-hydrolase [Microbaculum marinum]|uniref:MBL fold metallo-hydrolase n=1 Tax=Microbaculum marinum TaxID=1764581 RepID=A0AAW9RLG1_9HYPH
MFAPMCTTCGTEFPPAETPPADCPICVDDRQYVNPHGQSWTSLDRLAQSHRNSFRQEEAGLIGIGVEPHFAIGQRALLVCTPAGNVLWDCVSLIDDATRTIIDALGGLHAIAISHPHYYSAMVTWSEAFGGVPIHLHEDDRQWVVRPSDRIDYWSGGTKELLPGLVAIRTGGHFAGGTVLHWADGAEGKGALLVGDILQVTPDRRHVSFMRSYPNYIPLSPAVVERIVSRMAPFSYDRIYGAFWDKIIACDARQAVESSASRYVDAVTGNGPADAEP